VFDRRGAKVLGNYLDRALLAHRGGVCRAESRAAVQDRGGCNSRRVVVVEGARDQPSVLRTTLLGNYVGATLNTVFLGAVGLGAYGGALLSL